MDQDFFEEKTNDLKNMEKEKKIKLREYMRVYRLKNNPPPSYTRGAYRSKFSKEEEVGKNFYIDSKKWVSEEIEMTEEDQRIFKIIDKIIDDKLSTMMQNIFKKKN